MTAYLIGGPARVGKSTLFRDLRTHIHGQALELDLLKPAVLHWARPFPQDPLLATPSVYDYAPAEWVNILRTRDRILWDGIVPFLKAADTAGEDVLLEGCLWPDQVAELRGLDIAHKAVFLIDTGFDHVDRVLAAAHGPAVSNNWQSDWPDEKLRRWAEFNRHRSQHTLALARAANYPYADVADLGYDQAQKNAFDHLATAGHTAERVLT